MNQEKVFKASNGYTAIAIIFVLFFASLFGVIFLKLIPLIFITFFSVVACIGFVIVNPNESAVLVLFGAYKGTIKDYGFWWANPFYVKKKISLRAHNFDSEPIKVNDKVGNPIKIGVVLVWKVEDTFKTAFQVDDFKHFVVVQSEAALRKIAGTYPYDNFEDEDASLTLRSGGEGINDELEKEIAERLELAGVHVIEARINYIAYAEEIASAMLRRQQATAVIAAREKIVEGAVTMVKMALDRIEDENIVDLDSDKKAAMVSNLLVVLCADESAQPVLNTGSLYQ